MYFVAFFACTFAGLAVDPVPDLRNRLLVGLGVEGKIVEVNEGREHTGDKGAVVIQRGGLQGGDGGGGGRFVVSVVSVVIIGRVESRSVEDGAKAGGGGGEGDEGAVQRG